MGGVWGTASNDIYVPAATYPSISSLGVIAHWNGAGWTREDMPTNPPTQVHGVWGSSANDVWFAALDSNQGRLYHKVSGIWSEDTSAPYTIAFMDVWGSDASNVYLLGQDAGYGRVWKRSGSNWNEMVLPSVPLIHGLSRIWGLDANHVFVTGYHINASSNPDEGILLYYDGSTWTEVPVPVDCVQLVGIHGHSLDDLYIAGMNSAGAGVVYHVTNALGTWSEEVVDASIAGYGPVWSPASGALLASGYQPPAVAGALRVTSLDQMSPADTYQVDNLAYNPVSFWVEPDGVTVHFVHIATTGTIAGFYTGSCN